MARLAGKARPPAGSIIIIIIIMCGDGMSPAPGQDLRGKARRHPHDTSVAPGKAGSLWRIIIIIVVVVIVIININIILCGDRMTPARCWGRGWR